MSVCVCWLCLWGDRMGQSVCVDCVCGGDRMGQSVCVGCVCGGIEWVSVCVLVVFVGG